VTTTSAEHAELEVVEELDVVVVELAPGHATPIACWLTDCTELDLRFRTAATARASARWPGRYATIVLE
jgi:hypothetical protein